MRLKIATSAAALFSIAAMLSWPWVVGPRPADGAPQRELAAYAVRAMTLFGIVLVGLFMTLALALLLIRQTRIEYRKQLLDNLQDLVEGTMQDHAKRPQS